MNAPCVTQGTGTFSCAHCALPFQALSLLAEHVGRSGHDGMPRCACGTRLLSFVSLAAVQCNACRWQARDGMGPFSLRLLARSYFLKAEGLRAERKFASAFDHDCEARALFAVALEREEFRHA